MPRNADYRIFLFTCRDPGGDFRKPLAEALGKKHETHYIWLRRRPRITGPDGEMREVSIPGLIRTLRGFRDAKTPVYFNSTNIAFPYFTAFLRLACPRGLWILDIHDDLLYHYTGLKRLRKSIALQVMRRCSHLLVHAAPTLRELFPKSRHLGNASHFSLMERDGANFGEILTIASIDNRFDFALLAAIAKRCPDKVFHLYGQVYGDDDGTVRAQVERLRQEHRNIIYHGAYILSELPDILRRYCVTFAPYCAPHHLTRYIDPLRFYHCLNSGMTLITTPIPQAEYMQTSLHIIENAESFAALMEALEQGTAERKTYTPVTWEQKADQLIDIIKAAA